MSVIFKPTRHTNLIRTENGMYYMRAKIGRRVIRVSLKTDQEKVALLRLGERLKKERAKTPRIDKNADSGLMRDCITVFLERSGAHPNLKPRTKQYHRETIKVLRREWLGFDDVDAGQVTDDQCRKWAAEFRQKPTTRGTPISATRFNGTIDALRGLFAIAIEKHYRYDNPALAVDRMPVKQKRLVLPTAGQFNRLLEYLDKSKLSKFGRPLRKSKAADVVRFLAYSGARIDEARHVLCTDVSFERSEIRLRKTKNGDERTVPMIPEMREFLTALRAQDRLALNVLSIGTVKKVLKVALAHLGLPHITHHDLRHLFATRCIESGVDIPTVSRWLGHKDGGALAMRVYGHLRDEHSKAMAQKVKFG